MSGWSRAFLGAALGSILTLVLHPVSRPVILGYWYQPASLVASAPSKYFNQGAAPLQAPRSLEDASIWLQAGSERLVAGVHRQKPEIQTLLRVAEAAAHAEPDNAFWREMVAVYLHELGQNDRARAFWISAQTCKAWNDYQSNRLVRLERWLVDSSQIHLSWQSVLAFYQRSTATAREIEAVARWLHTTSKNPREDLELRLATIGNAALLVDGSRAISVGRVGSEIFDLGWGIKAGASRKDRYTQRYAFKSRVQAALGKDAADGVEKKIRKNEAWSVMTATDPAIDNPVEVLELSSLTGALPGTFFALGLAGIVFFLLGWATRFWPISMVPRVLLLGVSAVVLATLAYVLVGLPLVGMLVAMAVAFQWVSPDDGDRRQLKRLGTLFEFAVTVFASAIILVMGMLFFGNIASGASSGLLLGVPPEYLFGSTILAGIAIVILCLVLVVPPAWALSHRVQTAQVIRLMFQRLGSILAVICLSLAVILTPVMLLFDRGLTDKMDKLLENEPLYYLKP